MPIWWICSFTKYFVLSLEDDDKNCLIKIIGITNDSENNDFNDYLTEILDYTNFISIDQQNHLIFSFTFQVCNIFKFLSIFELLTKLNLFCNNLPFTFFEIFMNYPFYLTYLWKLTRMMNLWN